MSTTLSRPQTSRLKKLSLNLLSFFVVATTAASTAISGCAAAPEKDPNFLVKPYVQLGYNFADKAGKVLTITWFADEKADFKIKVKAADKEVPVTMAVRELSLPRQCFRYSADLDFSGDSFKKTFVKYSYVIEKNSKPVFNASGYARLSHGSEKDRSELKIVVFGDCGANTTGQKNIANQCYKQNPDLVVIPGDIVYQRGLFDEYLSNYFPIYNRDKADAEGVPLIRSVPVVPVLGNHDIALSGRGVDLSNHPGALGYFHFFQVPLNGFSATTGGTNIPTLKGNPDRQKAFTSAAQDSFPRMANFSFDYGNTHWTVIDGNFYMNWSDEKIRAWLREDLKKVKPGMWKFVTYHQPAFSIDAPHGKEQRMRLAQDILQEEKVDMVLCGHSHCYERSRPLNFKPAGKDQALKLNPDGTVDGIINTDPKFDGIKVTKANGVIHIVTGGGGANLYVKDPTYKPGDAHDYMPKFVADRHSLTVLEIKGKELKFKQLDEDGKVIDQITLEK